MYTSKAFSYHCPEQCNKTPNQIRSRRESMSNSLPLTHILSLHKDSCYYIRLSDIIRIILPSQNPYYKLYL